MARMITLRLSDAAYDAVKRHADADQRSMNSWIEDLLDAEDMRRRCEAHNAYLTEHPDVAAFAQNWADRNLGDITHR